MVSLAGAHHNYVNQTQDISINLLVNFRPGWDMQTVSQPDCVFLCTSSRITIILEKRCVRHGCTHPQHRVTNKEWVSEGIPCLHCHSPKVKHRLSTHVNWLDDCFSFSVHTLTRASAGFLLLWLQSDSDLRDKDGLQTHTSAVPTFVFSQQTLTPHS